jgi:hypothetical protein
VWAWPRLAAREVERGFRTDDLSFIVELQELVIGAGVVAGAAVVGGHQDVMELIDVEGTAGRAAELGLDPVDHVYE